MKELKINLNGENQVLQIPPGDDEIEISIFGPGYGESIILHTGNNDWFIIDSCIDPTNSKPAALSYFEKIGINPENSVKQIIATHWHDDHIRGLGEIVKKCKSAEFVCSAALLCDEFLQIVESYSKYAMMQSTGVKEFDIITKILMERKTSPKFAISDRFLWRDSIKLPNISYSVENIALSPSDTSKIESILNIAKKLIIEGNPKIRVQDVSPNDAGIVLFFKIDDIYVLLGDDLENTSNKNIGWLAILNSRNCPSEKASIFKIPHHGSKYSDNPLIWEKMLCENPISVLTPCCIGSNKLPTKKDVKRICRSTKHSYSTASFKQKKVTNRSRTVEKTIKETVNYITKANSSFGHVRIRVKIRENTIGKIECFGDAIPLNLLYTN